MVSLLAGMFFVAITNAILLNKGLAEFEAMFLVPNRLVVQCLI